LASDKKIIYFKRETLDTHLDVSQ